MTYKEKIEMFKEKKAFIDNISKAFEARPRVSAVDSVEYEVYYKKIDVKGITHDHFVEYIIVNFFGDGKSVKIVSGNSNTANFRAVGSMIDGGYYDEVRDYETLVDRDFQKVSLSNKLEELLEKPMKHISDVRACFNYCKDYEDIERVIDAIPSAFGSFYAESNIEEGTFVITNSYEEDGDVYEDEDEYEFYKEEE